MVIKILERKSLSWALVLAVMLFYLIPLVHAETAVANLKVIEAPQRPKYTELPGFSEISLLASIGGIAAFYLSKRKLNKKGIAPVVATILLIALTIAMFFVIFAFSKSFIKEQVEKNNGPVETACQSISFSAVLAGNSAYVTNTGNVVIYGFQVKGETEGTSKLDFARTSAGKLGIGDVDNLDLSTVANKYQKITLIPTLLGRGKSSGTGKLFVCNDKAMVIKQ